jgi:hypothetical protein
VICGIEVLRFSLGQAKMPQRSYELLQLVSFYILTEAKKIPVDCCDFSLISLLSYLMSWRNKFVADLQISLWFTRNIV